MRQDIMEILACPLCSGLDFSLDVLEEDVREIRHATLSCGSCDTLYEVDNGILSIMPISRDEVASEIEAWSEKIPIETFTDELHTTYREMMLSLPYLDERHEKEIQSRVQWYLFGKNFEEFGLSGELNDQLVLDIGAGRCWTSAALASRGARVIALDILTSLYLGLETGDVFIQERPVFFERVQADMHNLPFRDGMFDAIVVNVSAHHAADPSRFFSETRRVLKGEGRLILVSEPIAWRGDDPAAEVAEGIIEQQISLAGWFSLFKENGFTTEACKVKDGRGICCVLAKKDKRAAKLPAFNRRVRSSAHKFAAFANVIFWCAVHPLLPARDRFKATRKSLVSAMPEARSSLRRFLVALDLPTSARVLKPGARYLRVISDHGYTTDNHDPSGTDPELLGLGWFRPDPRLPGLRRAYRWADAVVPAPPVADCIYIELGIPGECGLRAPVSVTVAVDGVQAGTVDIEEPGISSVYLPLNDYRPAGRWCRVAIKVTRKEAVSWTVRLRESRVLGIYVKHLEIVPELLSSEKMVG